MIDKVIIASDHAGFDMKQDLVVYLNEIGIEVNDLGPNNTDSVDYPNYAHKLAESISDGVAQTGILVCGSGVGISIAANRHEHIRCALVTSETEACLSRKHNNANVLAMGGRIIGLERAKKCVLAFLKTDFEGGRHQTRIDMINKY